MSPPFNKLTLIISGALPAFVLLVLQTVTAGTLALTSAQQFHLVQVGVLAAIGAAVVDHAILRIARLSSEPLVQTAVRTVASVSCAAVAFYSLA